MDSRADYILEKIAAGFSVEEAQKRGREARLKAYWKDRVGTKPTKPTPVMPYLDSNKADRLKKWKERTKQKKNLIPITKRDMSNLDTSNAMKKKGSVYESKADYIMEKQAGLWNLVVKGGKKALKKGKETYKKMKIETLKIETLQKQIKALDNVLENMTNKKWESSDSDEVIIFRMRQRIFRKLQTLKSAARNYIKH